jgi:hypothetical protein
MTGKSDCGILQLLAAEKPQHKQNIFKSGGKKS